jgi:hypothetical protein
MPDHCRVLTSRQWRHNLWCCFRHRRFFDNDFKIPADCPQLLRLQPTTNFQLTFWGDPIAILRSALPSPCNIPAKILATQ